MTRKATMNQLFNLLQDEYNIKSASDIEAVLLDMFGGFIEQALSFYIFSLKNFRVLYL